MQGVTHCHMNDRAELQLTTQNPIDQISRHFRCSKKGLHVSLLDNQLDKFELTDYHLIVKRDINKQTNRQY